MTRGENHGPMDRFYPRGPLVALGTGHRSPALLGTGRQSRGLGDLALLVAAGAADADRPRRSIGRIDPPPGVHQRGSDRILCRRPDHGMEFRARVRSPRIDPDRSHLHLDRRELQAHLDDTDRTQPARGSRDLARGAHPSALRQPEQDRRLQRIHLCVSGDLGSGPLRLAGLRGNHGNRDRLRGQGQPGQPFWRNLRDHGRALSNR